MRGTVAVGDGGSGSSLLRRWRDGDDPAGIDFAVLALLCVAALVRLVSLLPAGLAAEARGYEAANVAYAFATRGTLADAYFAGQGPTAHLSPVSPMLAGGIEWLCGPHTPVANLALLAWSLGQVLLGYWLLFRLFRAVGIARPAALIGLALLCLAPLALWLETGEFRYWEGATAVCLAAALLLLLVRQEARATVPPRTIAVAGGGIAFAFFLNPPVGLALGACWALASLRRSWRELLLLVVVAGLALGALVLPWVLRNEQVFGRFIPLRSNFGLELAIAYHPAALGDREQGVVFAERLDAVHPAAGGPAVAIVRRIGEVRYAEARGRAARAWIAAHPQAALRLLARHATQYFFPPFWFFPVAYPYRIRALCSLYAGCIAALGLVSLALSALRRERGMPYVGLFVLIVSLPYAMVQPVYRYDYLVVGMLTFAAAKLLWAMLAAGIAAGRRAMPPRGRLAAPI